MNSRTLAVVLDGLDRVPWAELRHAYGSAVDVPDLLRRVAAPDEADALDALDELRGSILHQGNVCSATAPAVPFLATVLAGTDPGTARPGRIAHLLGDMADVRDPETPILAELRAAVTAQTGRLRALLSAACPANRLAAAFALAQCPGRAAELLPALHERWAVEPDPQVCATILLAVARLDPRSTLLTAVLADQQPAAVRAAAALAAARSPLPWPGETSVMAVRAGWADGDPWQNRAGDGWDGTEIVYPWHWDPIADLLEHLTPTEHPPVVRALLASTNAAVRQAAAQAGGSLIGEWRSVRPAMVAVLEDALADSAPEVRASAVWGIHRAGPAKASAADALADLVERDRDAAAGRALAVLVELGDPRGRAHLAPRIADGTVGEHLGAVLARAASTGSASAASVRVGSVAAGWTIPPDAELLDAVRRRLATLPADAPFDLDEHLARLRAGRPPEPQVSHAAERDALLELLRSWGPAASAAAPELAALLRANQSVGAVARSLTAIGSPAATEASDLVALLHAASAGGNGPNQLAAAHAAWRLSRDPQPAIDTAVRHIEAGQWTTGAVDLLADIGEPSRQRLPQLRASLARTPGGSLPEQTGHLALARLVWQWTGDARTALAAALAVMRDGWPESRVDAAILAHALGEPAAIDTLRALLAAEPPLRGIALVRATCALWRNTAEVVVEPLLAALAGRPNDRVLFAALDVLAEFGPAARSALPLLRRLADQDATVVYYDADDDVGTLDERARTLIRAVL